VKRTSGPITITVTEGMVPIAERSYVDAKKALDSLLWPNWVTEAMMKAERGHKRRSRGRTITVDDMDPRIIGNQIPTSERSPAARTDPSGGQMVPDVMLDQQSPLGPTYRELAELLHASNQDDAPASEPEGE